MIASAEWGDALALAGGLAATALVCLFAPALGRALGVLDYSDGKRKRHTGEIPQVGGIAIMVAFLVEICVRLLFGQGVPQDWMIAIACAAGAAMLGFVDDRTSLTPLNRVIILSGLILITFMALPQIYIGSIHWTGTTDLALPALAFYAVAAIALFGFVNAVNMADGQDGLVTGMFVTWAACLVILDGWTISSLVLLLASAGLVFACNLGRRLFLGDCGAYGVAFLFGLLALLDHAQGRVTTLTVAVWFFLPVADCLRLLVKRSAKGHSPFIGGCDHLHHILQDRFGDRLSVALYVGTVVISSLTATLVPEYADYCLAAVAILYGIAIALPVSESFGLSETAAGEFAPTNDDVLSLAALRAQRRTRDGTNG